MLRVDVKSYIKGYNIYLALKSVKHKLYGDLQSLPVPIYQWKDLSIDFVTRLAISTNWKGETYDSILVIIDKLTKLVYYKLVKVIINTLALAKMIIDIVMWHHGLMDSIISN